MDTHALTVFLDIFPSVIILGTPLNTLRMKNPRDAQEQVRTPSKKVN